jgi:hypothetical protein
VSSSEKGESLSERGGREKELHWGDFLSLAPDSNTLLFHAISLSPASRQVSTRATRNHMRGSDLWTQMERQLKDQKKYVLCQEEKKVGVYGKGEERGSGTALVTKTSNHPTLLWLIAGS